MAIELYKSQQISVLHSSGEPFSKSLLRSNDAPIDTASSVISGTASLIFSSFVVGELPVERNIQQHVVTQLSTGKTPKSDAFAKALKEVQKMQSELATSKSTLSALDPESNDAQRLQEICNILKENINLFDLLGAHSNALIAG